MYIRTAQSTPDPYRLKATEEIAAGSCDAWNNHPVLTDLRAKSLPLIALGVEGNKALER